jgi:hypothetical protein
MSPRRGSKPRRTDRLVVGRNVTLTLTLSNNWVQAAVLVSISTTKFSFLYCICYLHEMYVELMTSAHHTCMSCPIVFFVVAQPTNAVRGLPLSEFLNIICIHLVGLLRWRSAHHKVSIDTEQHKP